MSTTPGPLSSNPVLTWQEIVAVPSQTDGIVELNKGRAHYVAGDPGLPAILENLATLEQARPTPILLVVRLRQPIYTYIAKKLPLAASAQNYRNNLCGLKVQANNGENGKPAGAMQENREARMMTTRPSVCVWLLMSCFQRLKGDETAS